MFVITATSGLTISVIWSISPISLTPISTTAISVFLSNVKHVRGRPIRLLRLPGVFPTLNLSPRTLAIVSLALVFPTLPVIPTTGMSRMSIYAWAILPSAYTEDSASM